MRLFGLNGLGYAVMAIALLGGGVSTAFAQEPKNSINVELAAIPPILDLGASAGMLEYERLLGSKLSLFVRAAYFKYKFDDDDNVEDGHGTGLGVGVRFYPSNGMKGFYVGGLISSFKSKWDFTSDKGQSFESRGTGDTTSIQWGAEVGYRFSLGPRVSLTPAINVGSWVGADTTCSYNFPPGRVGQPCSKDSELGFYSVASVALGIKF